MARGRRRKNRDFKEGEQETEDTIETPNNATAVTERGEERSKNLKHEVKTGAAAAASLNESSTIADFKESVSVT